MKKTKEKIAPLNGISFQPLYLLLQSWFKALSKNKAPLYYRTVRFSAQLAIKKLAKPEAAILWKHSKTKRI